jgi:hypothetical protein
MGETYRLTGGTESELRQYANSQVEIRGTLESGGASSSRPGGPTGPGSTGSTTTGGSTSSTGTTSGGSSNGTGAGTGSAAGATASSSMSGTGQTLRVTSVRQIASICSSGR